MGAFLCTNFIKQHHIMRKLTFALFTSLCCTALSAQQLPDTTYLPPVTANNEGNGIMVAIDEAHHNFHTVDGRYAPFAKVLRNSGYSVTGSSNPFTEQNLKGIKILVIANAINEVNTRKWKLPTPSAFTKEEITAVNNWVKNGGSLFLIADHMPFAGAAEDLAKSFGFTFYNSFALDTNKKGGADMFTSVSKTLNNLDVLSITDLEEVATFTGQAFDVPSEAISILYFDNRYTILMPEEAWVFDKNVTAIPAKGKSQLAVLNYGKGKIAVSGEAAMFTAQTMGGNKAGMNSKEGSNNYKLLLGIMKWLKS
jgi:hypothetical protein